MSFYQKNNLQIFCFIFSLIFILKLNEPFRNEEICIISLSFKSSDLGFRSKDFFYNFWLIFYPLDPDPWTRIILWIRILNTGTIITRAVLKSNFYILKIDFSDISQFLYHKISQACGFTLMNT